MELSQQELLAKAILPSFGITAGITVIRNNASGYVYVATEANEETQNSHENHKHLETIGDMVERIESNFC
jgi:hypothetical protein